MIVIAPTASPQVYVPPLGTVQHPLAGKVMRQLGPKPTSLWRLINKLAAAEHPDHRARHRCWRLRYLGAVRELCCAKLLFRHRGLIATRDFAFMPRSRSPKRVSSSVAKSDSKMTGSIPAAATAEKSAKLNQPLGTKLVNSISGAISSASKTQSAVPSPRGISAAAGLLAMRPRLGKRRWTGFLDYERIRRGTPIKLPDGTVQPVFAILRNKVFVISPDPDRFLDRYDAQQVQRIKNPAAVLLGRLKSGRREKPSVRKQEAARRNGCLPPRAGRFRGRPRKFKLP